MRFTAFCFLFSWIGCFSAYAQHDSLTAQDKSILNPVDPKSVNPFLSDSTVKANRQKFMEDSISMYYLTIDSLRKDHFMDSILKTNSYNTFLQPSSHLKKRSAERSGRVRSLRPPWVIAVVIGLLLYTALLNLFFNSDLKSVLQSFYNKHSLSQTNKESGLINSWAFIGLFLLFCLTLGLVVTQYYNAVYHVGGFQLFILLSAAISLLMVLKFIILKFIGFVFEIGNVINEYIAVLNLTYFNMAFVFLCVSICLSLLANQFMPVLLVFTIGLVAFVFVWQYLRNSAIIISDFRFHKFYLFIYLCALEICPILILVKALNI